MRVLITVGAALAVTLAGAGCAMNWAPAAAVEQSTPTAGPGGAAEEATATPIEDLDPAPTPTSMPHVLAECQTATDTYGPNIGAWRNIVASLADGVELSDIRYLQTFEVEYLQARTQVEGRAYKVWWAIDVLYEPERFEGSGKGLYLVTEDFQPYSDVPVDEYGWQEEYAAILAECPVLPLEQTASAVPVTSP